MILGKPTSVFLFGISVGISFSMDFIYGSLIVLGINPVPSAYVPIGIYFGVLLLFGGVIAHRFEIAFTSLSKSVEASQRQMK